MQLRGYVFGIAVFCLFLLAAIMGSFAMEASYQETPDRVIDVRDEEMVVQVDEPVPVQNADARGLQDEIVIYHQGEQLVRGEDYEWDPGTGEVTFNASSPTVADGELALVSYAYEDRSQAVRESRPLFEDLVELLPYVALLLIPVVILSVMALAYAAKPRDTMGR